MRGRNKMQIRFGAPIKNSRATIDLPFPPSSLSLCAFSVVDRACTRPEKSFRRPLGDPLRVSVFAGLSRSAVSHARPESSARLPPALRTFNYAGARPCLSDIPFDARNWKSFGGRFHSSSAPEVYVSAGALHLLKSAPSPCPPPPLSLRRLSRCSAGDTAHSGSRVLSNPPSQWR